MLERKSVQAEEVVEGWRASKRLLEEAYRREQEVLEWCEDVEVRRGWRRKSGWVRWLGRRGGGCGKGKGRLEEPAARLEGAQSGGDETAEGALGGERLSREEFEELVRRLGGNAVKLRDGVADIEKRLGRCGGITDTGVEERVGL